MDLPRMDLLDVVNSLYAGLGQLGPKLSKEGKIVELRGHFPLSGIVGPLLRLHYTIRGYSVTTCDKPTGNNPGNYHQ